MDNDSKLTFLSFCFFAFSLVTNCGSNYKDRVDDIEDVGDHSFEENESDGDLMATGKSICKQAKVSYTDKPVKVRAAPGSDQKLVGRLEPDQLVDVLDAERDDVEVEHVTIEGKKSNLWIKIASLKSADSKVSGWVTTVYMKCINGKNITKPDPKPTKPTKPGPTPSDPGSTPKPKGSSWVSPMSGTPLSASNDIRVTLPFGANGIAVGHLGNDMGGNGNKVYAIAAGTLVYVHTIPGSNWVSFPVVRHKLKNATRSGDRVLYSRYGHTRIVPGLKVGSKIKKGQHIATIVPNGSFGPHLHIELCGDPCFSSSTGLTPGVGYTKDQGFSGTNVRVHKGARFYNVKAFLEAKGKL